MTVKSDIDDSDDLESSFFFTITYTDIKCYQPATAPTPVLSLGTLQAEYFYEIGSVFPSLEIDGADSGFCSYSVCFTDQSGIDLSSNSVLNF